LLDFVLQYCSDIDGQYRYVFAYKNQLIQTSRSAAVEGQLFKRSSYRCYGVIGYALSVSDKWCYYTFLQHR